MYIYIEFKYCEEWICIYISYYITSYSAFFLYYISGCRVVCCRERGALYRRAAERMHTRPINVYTNPWDLVSYHNPIYKAASLFFDYSLCCCLYLKGYTCSIESVVIVLYILFDTFKIYFA